MSAPPFDTLLICASPRSGSTLLCRLLEQSGAVGHPESWFRRQNRAEFAADWGLRPGLDGLPAFADYLVAARAAAAGQNASGIGSVRMMRDTFVEIEPDLRRLWPDLRSMQSLLARGFGRIGYLHLSRQDLVAQAVSRTRAEQSGLWHRIGDWEERFDVPDPTPRYDAAAIAGHIAQARADGAAWADWFARNAITPLQVTYETLAIDPVATVRQILADLGLPYDMPLEVRNERLADAINADWIRRFRAETG